MKRIFILLFSSVLLLSSCNTLTKTARTAEFGASLQSATVVDLTPATEHRVTYTMEPTKDILRGGEANVRQAAESEALTKYGNADVLLEPQYVVSKQRSLFGSKITSITVSGRPAYYTNFRALDDSVWCNPVFRGVNMHQRSLPLAGMKSPVKKKKSHDSYTPAYRTKGFAMYLTPFIGYGEYDCRHSSNMADGFSLGAFLTFGYQLIPYLYLGVGTGVNAIYTDGLTVYNSQTLSSFTYMPLFINARINLSKKQNTLFLDGKLGCSIYGDNDAFGDDCLVGLALGYSFGNVDVAFQYFYYTFGYRHHYYVDGYWGGYWEDEYESVDSYQYGISIGFRF